MSPRTLLRHSLGLAFATYVARAVMLVRGLAAAVVLGPAGFGAWNALSLVADYGGYASAGALQGLELRLPVAEERGERALAHRLVRGAWSVILAAFLVFALVVVVALALGTPALTSIAGPGPALVLLLAAGAQLALQVHSTALKARGAFPVVSQATALQAILGGGLGLALLARHGLWALAGGWLAGTLVALAWMRRAAPDLPLSPGHPRDGLALAWVGMPVFGAFLASLVLRSVDRLALVHAGEPATLGLYSLGLTAAGLVLYPPEAAAAVLYPRIAAAAGGARDPERTRAEVVRAHRALTLVLPLLVGIAMVWAAPAVGWWLPRYRGGVEALRLLAFGALLLSAATVPGYWLLGRGRAWTLFGASAACAVVTALVVWGVAARSPRPASVATAACFGYALFAVTLTSLAARDLERAPDARLGFMASSLLPAVWAGAAAFALCTIGPVGGAGSALARSVALALVHAPLMVWLGRGLGLRSLVRDLAGGRLA